MFQQARGNTACEEMVEGAMAVRADDNQCGAKPLALLENLLDGGSLHMQSEDFPAAGSDPVA